MFGLKKSRSVAFADELRSLLVGLKVQLQRHESSWSIKVGDSLLINTMMLWRLKGSRRIIVTAEDDGHQFGLPSPVDAEVTANEALIDYEVVGVEFDEVTGDVSIRVGDALTLQIITTSMGYETWTLYQNGEFYAAVGNEGLR